MGHGVERDGIAVVDLDRSKLLKVSIVGGMISTMNLEVRASGGAGVIMGQALHVFADAFKCMFDERCESPKHHS